MRNVNENKNENNTAGLTKRPVCPTCFEEAIKRLVNDRKRLQEENQKLKDALEAANANRLHNWRKLGFWILCATRKKLNREELVSGYENAVQSLKKRKRNDGTDVEAGPEPKAPNEVPQAPKEVSQAPKKVSQAPKEVSQAPKEVPQAPKEVSQAPKEVPQAPKEVPQTVTSEEPKAPPYPSMYL